MQCTQEPDCNEPATHSVTWPWGDTGHSCTPHLEKVKSLAHQLSRQADIRPLAQPAIAAAVTVMMPATLDEAAQQITYMGMALQQRDIALQHANRTNGELTKKLSDTQSELDVSKRDLLELQHKLVDMRKQLVDAQTGGVAAGESIVEGTK